MKTNITRENLENLYLKLELSTRQIAKQLNCSPSTIIYYLKKFNIPRRSKSEALKGIKNPMFGKAHSVETKNKLAKATKELMTEERKLAYSIRFSGNHNPMFGKTHSIAIKTQMSKTKKQLMEKPETKQKISDSLKLTYKNNPHLAENISNRQKLRTGKKNSFFGKKHNKKTKELISQANKGKFIGEKGSNWKGGVTPLKHIVRNCGQYIEWRTKIFKRDNYTCQNCGQIGGKICVDHIKPFAIIFIEYKITSLQEALNCFELWDLKNGRTLCEICHKNTETYGWNTYWQKIYFKQQLESQFLDLD